MINEFNKYHRVPFEYICGIRGSGATEDTGKISLGGRMDFSGGRFDTLPFPLGVPNIKEQKRKFLLFPFVHPMRDFIF